MVPVLIGLGSNLQQPEIQVQNAAKMLATICQDFRLSPLVASDPMYVTDQPEFINAVGIGKTSMSPRELLTTLKQLEDQLGRENGVRYGPRVIDLDLLAYGNLRYEYRTGGQCHLSVPHQKIAERAFVLVPLSLLDPEFTFPGLGPVQELLANCPQEGVRCLQN